MRLIGCEHQPGSVCTLCTRGFDPGPQVGALEMRASEYNNTPQPIGSSARELKRFKIVIRKQYNTAIHCKPDTTSSHTWKNIVTPLVKIIVIRIDRIKTLDVHWKRHLCGVEERIGAQLNTVTQETPNRCAYAAQKTSKSCVRKALPLPAHPR